MEKLLLKWCTCAVTQKTPCVTWNTTLCWDTCSSNYHETFSII